MKKNKINLHNHTNLSDGDYSPYELIDLSDVAGIKILAITDHDIVEAHLLEDLENYAKSKNIKLVKGIEISTGDESGGRYHIIGLFIDVKDKKLTQKLTELKKSRVDHINTLYKILEKEGYSFDLDKILKEEVITKAHIADYVISNSKNREKLIDYFGKIPTRGEFIETFLLPGQKFFVSQKRFHPKDAIKLIQDIKGVAVLAHPTFYIKEKQEIKPLIKKFLNWGIDGIEVYSIKYKIKKNGEKEEIDLREEFKEISIENNLLMSGGSDFHTDNIEKIGVSIELGDERVSVPEEEFLKIEEKARIRWNNKN